MNTRKIVLIGDPNVGKSALLCRLCRDKFEDRSDTTIGAAFCTHRVGDILLHIWDTAGSERFGSLVPMYVRGASSILVCFDRPDISTIQKHITEARRINVNGTIILVATKMDGNQTVRYPDIEEFAREIGSEFIYTSSKTGYNVKLLFDDLGKRLKKIPTTLLTEKTLLFPLSPIPPSKISTTLSSWCSFL
jgi:small GTP-binding protein